MCSKIFVGGVDANVPEEDIKSYFSQYGDVKAVELPFDHQRGRRRQFCFIVFESEASADAACMEPRQTIGGRECDIKMAQPQPRRMQHGGSYQMDRGNNSGFDNHSRPMGYGNRRGGGRGGGGYRQYDDDNGQRGNWRHNRTAVFYSNPDANAGYHE